jgi:hypothetical protein
MSMPDKILFPDIDPANPLREGAPIVRYMSIQAFLMLLDGNVFIPSIRKLQEVDPLESLLPSECIPEFSQLCLRLHEPGNTEWLQKRQVVNSNETETDVWLRELTTRRCIWCWYSESEESMGLWNTYGARGVAVVSSLKRVRNGFSTIPHATGTSVGLVQYVPRNARALGDTCNDPDWLYRPYYFKHTAYTYEREIRFVIGLNSTNTQQSGGALFPVDPKQLIEKVIISPQFRLTEARAFASFLRKFDPDMCVELSRCYPSGTGGVATSRSYTA